MAVIQEASTQMSHLGETPVRCNSASGAVTTRVQRLVREMNAAWRQGGGCSAEQILDRHRDLAEHKDAAVRIIYEEICLRQEVGQEVTTAEIARRFPQWQAEIQFLLSCNRLLVTPFLTPTVFPSVGEVFNGFRLLAELGRGAQGCVFLANQHALADRAVVLKMTPCDGQEHLALARLQHTHIVPLYEAADYPERNLRVLCMPYLGGTSWQRLLQEVQGQPLHRRTGRHLVEVLDCVQADTRAIPTAGSARAFLAQVSYVEAVCWIGACLADALQYAHERGLVHLDLKPANILLAADGQPLLLDFHLAREPVPSGELPPEWLGGTRAYMSPEQLAAYEAIPKGRHLTTPVDGRSDVYSLGIVLYEALGGPAEVPCGTRRPRLRRSNGQVSVGLEDIVHKCLASEPSARYATAADLAADLRRHLDNLPLQGVRNRSGRERFRKWRRRRPYGLALFGMLAAVVLAFAAVAGGLFAFLADRRAQARQALVDGHRQLAQGHCATAGQTFQHGLALSTHWLGSHDIEQELRTQLARTELAQEVARREQAVQELHRLAEQIRFHDGGQLASPAQAQVLEASCRAVWEQRVLIRQRLQPEPTGLADHRLDLDLLDLAILWGNLRVRLASGAEVDRARQEALQVLTEAEALFGPSPVLTCERQLQEAALGAFPRLADVLRRAAVLSVSTPWEHFALGRILLSGGDLPAAVARFEQAVRLQPESFWPNFYLGVCAHRKRRHEEAVRAFTVCVALAPRSAECFYNRALAYTARGQCEPALWDYDRALELAPGLAAALLNRGLLHLEQGDQAAALRDLERALDLGAPPATTHYNLALVHRARKDWPAALASLARALRHDPQHPEALKLRDLLQQR